MILEIILSYCQYGVLYLGSYYTTGPYIHVPHFGNSNLGKLPYGSMKMEDATENSASRAAFTERVVLGCLHI